MTPQDFIAQWGAPGGVPGPGYHLNEEQGAQSHFLDLCALLDVPKPGSRAGYRFEEKSAIVGGKTGYADVFMQGVFAWENKAPGKNLDSALKQLLTYSLALSNPPILVVCDRLTIRIHTQFTGHPSTTHELRIDELDQPDKRALLRRIWTEPESFKPRQTNRDITEAAARSFATLAESLRARCPTGTPPAAHAQQVAHFLTQCLFCFFAEDVGLLPARMFERLVGHAHSTPERLTQGLAQLFGAMQQGGLFGVDDIPWFNGGLFQSIAVPPLATPDLAELRRAAELDWSAIDPSIFGTLFERGLDPAKRSQLGAHYTDPDTIERLLAPVIRRPLLQKWELVAQQIQALAAKISKKGDKHYRAAHQLFIGWLQTLKDFRALDPACGSGNFLYLALRCLKDVELHSHLQAAELGLEREQDLVTGPHNVLGIELNEYAAELARVTVWIGELQWRLAHGYPFKTNPVLDTLQHIECRDALLDWGAAQVSGSVHDFAQQNSCSDPETGTLPQPGPQGTTPAPQEATWPRTDVVVGNPPFLGGSKKRGELGNEYFDALNHIYGDRVPGGADLVCYWFERARTHINAGQLQRAGLVTTNSIRGGANRKVLDAITDTTRIFEAWSDEPWVNNGAAVRVSLVCFGDAPGTHLNGSEVPQIYADLTAPTCAGDALNLGLAQPLPGNLNASFQGASKKAKFEIPADLARQWLTQPNPHGQPNSNVLKPWANGFELSRGPQHQWIIDFGNEMAETEAALYELPFAYVVEHIKPERLLNNRESYRKYWWRFAEARPGLRLALRQLPRFIATVAHSKHRFFTWLPATTSPDQALITIARADDTTFGILHSRFHELWSLRMCTFLGVGNDPRYTPTTCFETFPFPAGLTPADTAHQRTETLACGAVIPADLSEQKTAAAPDQQALKATKTIAINIAQAAQRLHQLRQRWLNPPEWTDTVPEVVPLGLAASPYPDRTVAKPGFEKELAQRTLTKLYNQRPAWLAAAHQQLDAAVAAAYGWADYQPDMEDDELLRRLLALNLQRSA